MTASARDISIGAMFGALGVVVPILFHLVGLGAVFLPMHLPVLAAGLLIAPPVAAAVGLVTPLISSALTGMPPIVPVAVIMTVELAALAGSASLLYRRLRLPLIVSVVLAILVARAVGALVRIGIAPLFGVDPAIREYLAFSLLQSWPGIVIQLAVIPPLMAAINRQSAVRPVGNGGSL